MRLQFDTVDAVICGGGIIGLAVAAELAQAGMGRVLIVEQGDPLAMTSDKSTECYRNWWPGPDDAMVGLINRSIDRLEQIDTASGGRIRLNRRGYAYASADPARIAAMEATARQAATQGVGPLRIHRGDGAAASYQPAAAHGWRDQPDGADLLLDRALIQAHFPYLSERTGAVLHVRRCGWFSGQQLGMLLLEQARAAGATLLRGRVTAVEQDGGRVTAVIVEHAGANERIATPLLINAAGPLAGSVAGLLGIELPLFNELHLKAAIADTQAAVGRDAPLLIWNDPISLEWDDDEREALREDPQLRWLTEPLPPGVHCRPEGEGASTQLLMLWDYHNEAVVPQFPPPLDDQFSEIVVRGLAAMLPGMQAYTTRMPRAYLDGGYYTKTPENRPLIGPLAVEGAYIVGAMAGFGLMAACAAAELLADHVLKRPLPAYAAAFHPARYADAGYQARLGDWDASGQL